MCFVRVRAGDPRETLQCLCEERVWLLDVDSEILDRLFHDGGLNLSVMEQLMKRGQRNEARIHLEEVAQRLTAATPSEAIGSE